MHPLLAPGFRIVAYRGGAGERPENTLAAFEHAFADDRDVSSHDSSTNGLINHYKRRRNAR